MLTCGLLTTWGERCGIAEYAVNLVNSVPDVSFKIIARPWEHALETIRSCDVVVVNHEPGLFQWMDHNTIKQMQFAGKRKPVILIMHTSNAVNNRSVFTSAFDKVVVHEKTPDGFVHIPHGIVEQDVSLVIRDVFRVGTVGFPFPWKGFSLVAEACKVLGYPCRIIAPESRHWDTNGVECHLRSFNPDVEYIKEWLSVKDTIIKLAECSVNVFAYQGGNAGISGAVRLGIAAQRSVVISRCRQFRDLYEDYNSQFYVAENLTVDGLAHQISLAVASRIVPRKVLEDQGWSKVGKMYSELIVNSVKEVCSA